MAKSNGSTRSISWRNTTKPIFEVKMRARNELSVITNAEMERINSIFSKAYREAGISPDTDRLELSSRGIDLIDRKNLEFEITYDPNDQSMTHDLFLIHNENMRGKNLSKRIYKELLPLYDRIGVKTIRVHAGDENGGYTWARYGFRANRGEAIGAISRIKNQSLQLKAEKVFDKFYSLHSIDTKFPMHLIADKPWGKEALSGTKWRGEIDLRDSSQRRRYLSYLK